MIEAEKKVSKGATVREAGLDILLYKTLALILQSAIVNMRLQEVFAATDVIPLRIT